MSNSILRHDHHSMVDFDPDIWILLQFCSFDFSQHLLDLVFEGERVVSWTMVVSYPTCRIDQELGEVPRNLTCSLVCSTVEFAVHPKTLVDWVSTWPVHFDLWEQWELSPVLARGKRLDLSLSAWFLPTELVAWECQDFEALLAELLMELYHFLVVRIGQASLGGHIDNHDAFLAFDEFLKRVDHFSIDILSSNFPEGRMRRSYWFSPILKEHFSHNTSHNTYLINMSQ